jgi:site-specific DNA-methyltransferase (adenine-specific)
MKTSVMFSSNSDEWATPANFFAKLNEEFHFTLDVCATAENHKCERYFTEQDDGLTQDWKGETVFCNPPYSKIA